MAAKRSSGAMGLVFISALVMCVLAHSPPMPSHSISAGGTATGAVNAMPLESTVSIETSPSIVQQRSFLRPVSVPFGPPLPPPRVVTKPAPSTTTGATGFSLVTKTILIITSVPTEAVTSQNLQSASGNTKDPNSALLRSSRSWHRTLQRSGALSQSIERTRADSTAASNQESSTQPTALTTLLVGPSGSQPAVFTILPAGISPPSESSVLIKPTSTLTPSAGVAQPCPNNSGQVEYYPAQLSKHPDLQRRRYVYSIAYSVAATATTKMLNDLAAMQECQDLTWCRSAIWSWLSLAAQQSVMRSSIAQDETMQRPCDEVCLAEHAIEGSSRSALFMKQKIYKLITGMRRLPEYGEVDWDDVLLREKAATNNIDKHVRMLQNGPVVEHEEVVEALRTVEDEPPKPLPTLLSGAKPWDGGAGGFSSMRNLISGLDESSAESLRSLSEGPSENPDPYPNGPEPEPQSPGNPEPPGGPGAPGSPQPTMQPKPPSRMDATKASRVTRALKKLSSKFKNMLESMKNMFKRPFERQSKEPAQPELPRSRPLTRDPLKPQPGSSKASRSPPKLESKPQVTNPGDYMDDFQWGNLKAKGFNTLDDLPRGPPGIQIDTPSRGLTIGGFGGKKLDLIESLSQELFDSKRGSLVPFKAKLDIPEVGSAEWGKDTIESYNRDWLQDQGLIKTLEPGEIGEPAENGGWVVQSSQALRPANGDLSKGKWKEIEGSSVECPTTRKRSASIRKRGCLTAPGGLAILTMADFAVLDTFGQPLISTVGADGIRRMQGIRATSDGVFHLLDDAGDFAKESGSLAWNAVTGLLIWAALDQTGHTGVHNPESSTEIAASSSGPFTTLQTLARTTRRPTTDDSTLTTKASESVSLLSTASGIGAATTTPRSAGEASTSTSKFTSTSCPAVTSPTLPPTSTPFTGYTQSQTTRSTSTSRLSTTSTAPKSDIRTSTTAATATSPSSLSPKSTKPLPFGPGGGPIILPPRPTNAALIIQPCQAISTPRPGQPPAPSSCPWISYNLHPYEVWSNPSLPPGCSSPIFDECTSNFQTYTGCNLAQNARACKKHKKHNPAKQCPNKPFSDLSANYFNHLGSRTSQKGCVWNRTLKMGMVWSRPNLAPGCSEPVLWECTVDWQRWFYEGKGVKEWKWKRPGYCFGANPVRGHDEAVVMGCGYSFKRVGCREKFLGLV